MFEHVLNSLNMTPEEQVYIREVVENEGGLGKLLESKS